MLVTQGETRSLSPSRRAIIGAIEITEVQRSSQFFRRATSSSGFSVRDPRSTEQKISLELPREYITSKDPKVSESVLYLVTAEYGNDGETKLFIEGKIYGIIPG